MKGGTLGSPEEGSHSSTTYMKAFKQFMLDI